MKPLAPAITFLSAGLLVAEELPKLSELDPFTEGSGYEEALERHTGPPFVAELPTEALSKEFKEPLLSGPKYTEREVYRLTIFPAFDKPMTFRLEVIDESRGMIHVKRLSGKGGYDLGKIELSSSVSVEGRVFAEVLKKVREPRSINPYGKLTQEHVQYLWGLDGSNWYLEGRRADNYTFTHVWSARSLPGTKKWLTDRGSKVYQQLDPEPFISACMALLKAAGFQPGRHSDALEPTKRESGPRD
ncbi:MAG: hypothetical protein KDM63_06410 [Verrucomicrobiae bacterium]|nr:hypothetical protein [Verrucomicrobiae bacterium]